MRQACLCRCDIDVQSAEPPQCTPTVHAQTTTGVHQYRAPSGGQTTLWWYESLWWLATTGGAAVVVATTTGGIPLQKVTVGVGGSSPFRCGCPSGRRVFSV